MAQSNSQMPLPSVFSLCSFPSFATLMDWLTDQRPFTAIMSNLNYALDHLAWQQRVLRETLDCDRLRKSLPSFTPKSSISTADSALVTSNPNQLRDSATLSLPAKFRIVALTRAQTTRWYALLSLPSLLQTSVTPLSPQLPSKPPSRRTAKPASQPVSRPTSKPQTPPSRPPTSLSWKTSSTQHQQIEELERLLQAERAVIHT